MDEEKCWSIPSGKTNIPARIERNCLKFEPGIISYDDYEMVGRKIDHDRVYVDDINVYSWAWENGLQGVPPAKINGKKVLHGKCFSSYSDRDGTASICFLDEEECSEHAKRLEARGIINVSRRG